MIKYDEKYYYNLLKIHTHTARQISDIRWKFVSQLSFNNKWPIILDYGCGVGWFAAFKPAFMKDENMDTFDIMPVPQTGIRHSQYDLIALWDVLEHIPDFTELAPLLEKTDFVALSIPIKPKDVAWKDYYHLKPGEHLHYYEEELLIELFRRYGFDLLVSGQPECPPRKMVWNFIFQKKDELLNDKNV